MLKVLNGLKIKTLGIAIAVLLTATGVTVVATSFFTIAKVGGMGDTWQKFDTGPAAKGAILNELRGAIGFGGMIHHFKNFVLRMDRPRIVKIHAKFRDATVALTAYEALGVNDTEKAALRDLGRAVARYADAVAVAERLASAGKTSREIDEAVRIDDTPALQAMAVLDAEIQAARETSANAVYGAVATVSLFMKTVTALVGVLLFMLVAGLFWFARAQSERQRARAALREGERRFKHFAEAATDWFWEMDENLRFSYFSDRLLTVTGMRPEDILGKTRHELDKGDPDRGKWRRHLADLEARRPFRDFRYTYVAPDGRRRHWSVSGVPLFDERGEFKGYRGTGSDLTIEVEAETRAKQAQQQLLDAVESSAASFILYDADERLVLCNSKAREFFPEVAELLVPGAHFEDLTRARLERATPALDAGSVEDRVRKRLDQFRHPGAAVEEQHADGRWTQAFERRTTDGGTVCIRTDITELKRAEEAIRELGRQNDLILGAAGEGIYGLDLKGRTTFVNPAAAGMIGWEPEDLIGKPQHDILHHTKPDGSPYPREECPIYAAFRDGELHHASDEVFWRKDGSSFPVEYTSTPIRENGNLLGAVVVFRDISERKRAEEALRESEARAKQAQQQLLDAIESISEGFALYDSDDRLVLCNSNYREPFDLGGVHVAAGVRFEDLMRTVAHGGRVPAAVGREEEWLRDRMRRHREAQGVFELRYTDGRWLRIGERKTSDGGIVVVRSNITEIKLAEERLTEKEEQFRNLIEGSIQGVLIHERSKVCLVNRAYAKIFGYDSPEEFLAQSSIYTHVAPRDRRRLKKYARDRLQGRKAPTTYEFQGVTKDGSRIWLENHVRVVKWEGGRAIQRTLVDITERKRAEAALRESEASLANAQRIAHIGNWEWNVKTNQVRRSAEMNLLLGMTPEDTDTSREAFLKRVHPGDREALDTATDGLLENREPCSLRFRIVLPDGAVRVLYEQGEVTLDKAGEPVLVTGTTQDITERARAEETSRRLAAAIEGLSETFVLFDADDRIVVCNEQFRDINRAIPEATAPGTRFEDFIRAIVGKGLAPEALGREEEWIQERLERHRTPHGPFELARQDGRCVLVSEHRLADGGTATIAADITERKRAEEELREGEQRIRAILNNVADSVVTIDETGNVRSFNPAAERAFGYAADEVIGRNVAMLMGEPDHDRHDGYIRKYLRTGKAKILGVGPREVTGRRKDGSTFPLELAVSEVTLDEKRVFIAALRDITERKRAEEQLLEAKEQAELANRAKSEFLANMSHELRTPLNAVIGFSEMIHGQVFGKVGNARYLEYAKDINDSGKHLLELITDILDLSKIEAGKLELYEEDVDVARAIRSCLTLVKERAEAGGLTLERRIPSDLPALRADERKLKQILLNLLSNAVKFTPDGGKITLAAEVGPRRGFVIRVTDSGIGIAPEDIATALIPFGQVDSALSRKYEGTGLGLPLTKALAELHGATLELTSEIGAGTTATVRFPAERIVARTASAA
ncbi:MAG: PAS domain S-box protein [Proteobacteria bacterium]|nr:PAS domain S-box protein [Pseudomonadota bacterium]